MNYKGSKNTVSCDWSTKQSSVSAGTEEDGHWVKDLFPLTFRLSLNEHIDASMTTTVHQSDGLELPKVLLRRFIQDPFPQLTKCISPLDIETIKNVYYRVWLMTKNKQDEEDTASRKTISQPDLLQQPADIAQSGSKLLQVTSAVQEAEQLAANPHCIWDSSEIDVIRKAFRAMSDENAELRGQLSVLEHNVKLLTDVRYKQRNSLQHLKAQFHEAISASQRLQMLVEHLKTDLDQSAKELVAQRCIQTKLAAEVPRLKQLLSTATSQQLQVVATVEAKWLSMFEEQKLAESITKAELMREVTKLVDNVNQLQQQLDKEKQDHARTHRALEHLRLHFSGLPATVTGKQILTRNDQQLTTWSYN